MRDRQSVKRADHVATCQRVVGFFGRQTRAVGHQGDDGVQLGVEPCDPREMRVHHLGRRHVVKLHPADQLGGGEETEVAHAASLN